MMNDVLKKLEKEHPVLYVFSIFVMGSFLALAVWGLAMLVSHI